MEHGEVRGNENGKVNGVMLRVLVVKVSLPNSELLTPGGVDHMVRRAGVWTIALQLGRQ